MTDYKTTEGHKIEVNKYYSNKRGDTLFVCAIIPTDRYPIKAKKIGWGLGTEPLEFLANGQLDDPFVLDGSLDIMRPRDDEEKVDDNYESMSMRQLMKLLANNTDNVSDEEFEATIRRIMGSKVEEAMQIATDEAIKLYESELEKYIKREFIYQKALKHIESTENMTWAEKEKHPYNWDIAKQAIINAGDVK